MCFLRCAAGRTQDAAAAIGIHRPRPLAHGGGFAQVPVRQLQQTRVRARRVSGETSDLLTPTWSGIAGSTVPPRGSETLGLNGGREAVTVLVDALGDLDSAA